jgi:diaminopimelate decarboxylase
VTLHIGSQIWDTSAIREAVEKIKPIFLNLREKGFPVTSFDIGGGLGVDYLHGNEKKEEDLLKTYGSDMAKQLSDLNAEVYCEPGRFLVAHAGVLLAQVQYVKRTPYKNFLILNTGMHHLMRPSLYQAFHRIFPLTAEDPDSAGHELYDVVGPICESADVLGRDRRFSLPKEGDWFAIADVGAYGWVMANHYNAHSLPDEVVLGEGQ